MSHNELLAPASHTQPNVGGKERALSVAAGIFMLVRGVRGFTSSPFTSTASILTGGYLLFRGTTGNCPLNTMIGRNSAGANDKGDLLHITEIIQVNRPRQAVYAYWRQLENLPKFMHHLKSVTQIDSRRSHWEARLPGGIGSLEWDATIIHELANYAIAWRSDKGAMVENAGEVEFMPLPGQSTAIRATISYRPPVGQIGYKLSEMFNDTFEEMIREDLQRFKQMAESHELQISTAESQAPIE
jgi:uncharacterized membrane protein